MRNLFLLAVLFTGLLAWNGCKNAGESAEAKNAWVEYDGKGELKLFGKKTALESLKAGLVDSLSHMKTLPDAIPVHYTGEVLMGMRQEIETQLNEALQEAGAQKGKQ